MPTSLEEFRRGTGMGSVSRLEDPLVPEGKGISLAVGCIPQPMRTL